MNNSKVLGFILKLVVRIWLYLNFVGLMNEEEVPVYSMAAIRPYNRQTIVVRMFLNDITNLSIADTWLH